MHTQNNINNRIKGVESGVWEWGLGVRVGKE
jgi:hypothetical protein